jgi:hypothetical protein
MASAALAASANLGCRKTDQPQAPTTSSRTDVPLRVVYCGSQSDIDVIGRGWAAVSPQPLEISLIEIRRESPGGLINELLAACPTSDVIVYPLMAIAELFSQHALVEISEADFELAEKQGGRFLASLRNGVARFAGGYVNFPLGALQPALITADPTDELKDWQQYHQWVESVQGAAAEPLAGGWAGAMFLWRAASEIESGWLFSRQDLQPQIDTSPYQKVLAQMRDTSRLYKSGRVAPQEIWARLRSGALKGALGFAFTDDLGDGDLSFSDPPDPGMDRLAIDPFAPIASLSSQSRQTAASKQFIRWISGGEGRDSVRREIAAMTVTRTTQAGTGSVNQSEDQRYDAWLRRRLQTPVTVPTLQLLSAEDYYATLDRQVIRCLEGEIEPVDALAVIAKDWRAIGDRVGIEKQQRAWRQAQGMTA